MYNDTTPNKGDLELPDGVYSNGLPHPTRRMRARMALELAAIGVLTVAFLALTPKNWQNNWIYLGLALLAFGLILPQRRAIEEKIWGPPESPEFDRVRRCVTGMFALTFPPVILFLLLGIATRHWWPIVFSFEEFRDPPVAMFHFHFFLTLILYIPWVLLQQTLFQFYLLGRLRALLPYASPLLLATINGILYGLVHWPSGKILTLVTVIGGICWSYSYYRDRYVLPLALSHGMLATTFFYWIYGRDIFEEMVAPLMR